MFRGKEQHGGRPGRGRGRGRGRGSSRGGRSGPFTHPSRKPGTSSSTRSERPEAPRHHRGKGRIRDVDGAPQDLLSSDAVTEGDDSKHSASAPRSYPLSLSIRATAIDFGSKTGPSQFRKRSTVQSSAAGQCRVEVQFDRRLLFGFFSIPSISGTTVASRRFRFLADLKVIKELYICSSAEDGNNALLLCLPYPPKYFWTTDKLLQSAAQENEVYESAWQRATDIMYDMYATFAHPVSAHNDIPDPGYIEIGRWTAFRFEIDRKRGPQQLDYLREGLHDLNIDVIELPNLQVLSGSHTMWTYLDRPSVVVKEGASALLADSTIYLPFEIRYQLEVCISRGILNEHNVTPQFLSKLSDLDPVKAQSRLEYLTDVNSPLTDPMQLLDDPDAKAYIPNTRIPHYCALVRKASITPTTVRFNTASVEASNRVIRHYRYVADRFLRVQFVEESESGMLYMNRKQDEDISKRVLRVLHKGIKIGDRTYHFLAFGNSQLRERGAYFFCATEHLSCDDIRRWMGSFDHIRSIAKYSARLGQCFSTSRNIRGITAPSIRPIKDIERNGYCFTDGVGMMSQLVAEFINNEMFLEINTKPTAFQFRLSGYKGVLAVWPGVAAKMEIHTRPSQEKFKADSKGLEILRCAKNATATLNRQTITILECLGVPAKVFEDLLEMQLECYEKAMADNTAAIEMLTRFVDENQTTLLIADLLRAGFRNESEGGVREPFVTNILNLWKSWSLKLLREKARIYVEKSAFLLGCVDETGTLRGHSKKSEQSKVKDVNKLPQIFLQLSDPQGYNTTTIIQGICIVGRNPSLHPGDIRIVQAVDNPKLHHLRDVVVFPSKGDRPVPHMLSGGDLDGDDFFVMWDPNLIPTEWNHSPMDYVGPKPTLLERDVNINDLKGFFLEFMRKDNLGPIAVAHLGFADLLGPKSSTCLRLCSLHSTAVDYNKSGEPAHFDPVKDNPKKWPHFMAKKSSPMYHSTKALGKLYDRVVRVPADFVPQRDQPFDARILKQYEHNEETLAVVRQLKHQYDTAVRRILAQQNLATEFELWTGYAMSKPAVGSDYKRWEDIGRENESLRSRFREMCQDAMGSRNRRDVENFVSAMYKVTDESRKDDEANGMVPLISFPWIFPEEMIRLAAGEYTPRIKRSWRGPQSILLPLPEKEVREPEPQRSDVKSHVVNPERVDEQDGHPEKGKVKETDTEEERSEKSVEGDQDETSKESDPEEVVQEVGKFYFSDLKEPTSDLVGTSATSIVTDEGLTNSEDAFDGEDDGDESSMDSISEALMKVRVGGGPKKRSAMDRLAELFGSDDE